MVTVGFGDIIPTATIAETMFTALTMYIGVVISCSTIGNLTNVVANMDSASAAYNRKLDNLKTYMNYRRLPGDLRIKINHYYEYLWSVTQGVEESQLLGDLPPGLSDQIRSHVLTRLLERVEELMGAPAYFHCALAGSMRQRIFSPKDAIIKRSEMMSGIYFLCRGVASIMDDRGMHEKERVEEGGHFQEVKLFEKERPSTKTVMATSYCEVYVLRTADYFTVTEVNDEFREVHASMLRKEETRKKTAKKANKFFGTEDFAKKTAIIGPCGRQMLPGSKFRKGFDVACFFALVMYVIFIPLHFLAYYSGDEAPPTPQLLICLSCLYIADAFFLVDMLLNFRFFSFTEDGAHITDPKRIRKQYTQTWFWVDMIAAFPLELLAPAFGLGLGRMAVLRLNKAFRLGHGMVYLEQVERGLSQSTAFKRILNMYATLIAVSHLVACMWILVADSGERDRNFCGNVGRGAATDAVSDNCTETWRSTDENADHLSITYGGFYAPGLVDYFRSLYWAIVGMSTIGYGDIVPAIDPRINVAESWYAMGVILVGGLIYPATIGGMASLMSKLGAQLSKYKTMLMQIREFITRENLSTQLQNRIIKFYNYRWTRQGGIDEIAVLKDLPSHLRLAVSGRISREVCDNIPFFDMCDKATVEKIVALLEPAVFLPTDVIIRAGHFGKEFYLLDRGLVQVTDRLRKTTFGLLHSGDYFGEGALLDDEMRSATIVALQYCDCFVLTQASFMDGLKGVSFQKRDAILAAARVVYNKKIMKNKSIMENLVKHVKLSTTMGFEVPDTRELSPASWRHPDSAFRYIWDIILLLVILWNVFAIPFRIAFLSPAAPFVSTLLFLDYAFDLLMIADVALSFNFFAFMFEGQIVAETPEIRTNYRKKGSMFSNVVAAFPWECVAAPFMDKPWLLLLLSLLRVPKLTRALQLMKYTGRLERAIEERQFMLKASHLKLIYLAAGILGVAHWAACLFYCVTRFFSSTIAGLSSGDSLIQAPECANLSHSLPVELVRRCKFSVPNLPECITPYAACQWNGTWIKHQIESDLLPPDGGDAETASDSIWHYIRALNWALPTLVVVVIGDVIPVNVEETIYCVIVFLIGLLVNATVIGNIAGLVANIDTTQGIFRQRVEALDKHLSQSGMSDDLRTRSRNYLDYLWESQKGFHWDVLIENLPVSLRRDIKCELMLDIFTQTAVFADIDEDVLGALSEEMNLMLYNPGDVVINAGDASTHIYFVKKGNLDVVHNGIVVAKLEEGQFFGESALLVEKPRLASIFASNCVELFEIHRESFDTVTRAFPETRGTLLARIQQRISHIGATTARAKPKAPSTTNRSSTRMSLSDYDHGIALLRAGLKSKRACSFQKARLLFRPGGTAIVAWEIVCMCFGIYWIVMSPLQIAFTGLPVWTALFSDGARTLWSALDILVEVFFIVDIGLRMSIFTFLSQGKLVVKGNAIRRHYLNGAFLTDLVSSLPIDLVLVILASAGMVGRDDSTLAMLRTIRLVKVLRLSSYSKTIARYFKGMGQQQIKLVVQVFGYYMLCQHIYACVWVFSHRQMSSVGKNSTNVNSTRLIAEAGEAEFVTRTWATKDGLCDPYKHDKCLGAGLLYARGLYFVITVMSTVGYGDIRPYTLGETLFNNLVVLSGAIFFAAIIGSFQGLFAALDSSSGSAFKSKLDQITQFMDFRDLPPHLRRNIRVHYRSVWKSQHGVDVTDLMQDLPLNLRMDLMHYQERQVFQVVEVLRDCELSAQKRLALCLKRQTFVSDSTIYEAGSVDDNVYFVVKGTVKLEGIVRLKTVEDTSAITEMVFMGGHFGESVLTAAKPKYRKVTATAIKACSLFSITRSDFQRIIALSAMEEQIRLIKSVFHHGYRKKPVSPRTANIVASASNSPTRMLSPAELKVKRENRRRSTILPAPNKPSTVLVQLSYPKEDMFAEVVAAHEPVSALLRNSVVMSYVARYCEKRCIAEHVMFWTDYEDYLDLFDSDEDAEKRGNTPLGSETKGEDLGLCDLPEGAVALVSDSDDDSDDADLLDEANTDILKAIVLPTLKKVAAFSNSDSAKAGAGSITSKLEADGEDVLLRQKRIAVNRIYDTFLCPTAKYELCLTQASSKQIYSQQDNPTRSTYDALIPDVEGTIRNTILPEFMRSQEYKEYQALMSVKNAMLEFHSPRGMCRKCDRSRGERLSCTSHIFQDVELFQIFGKHIKNCGYYEHFLMHYQVHCFTGKFLQSNPKTLQAMAFQLYNAFLVEDNDSPFFCELPLPFRKRVGRTVGTPSFEMFEECDKRLRSTITPIVDEFAQSQICADIMNNRIGTAKSRWCCSKSSTVAPMPSLVGGIRSTPSHIT